MKQNLKQLDAATLTEARELTLLVQIVRGLGCHILRTERTEQEIARGSLADLITLCTDENLDLLVF